MYKYIYIYIYIYKDIICNEAISMNYIICKEAISINYEQHIVV